MLGDTHRNALEALRCPCNERMTSDMSKIYHGAPGSVLLSILEQGIRPRPNDHPGNWDVETSREGLVYLTDAHPVWSATAPGREYSAVIFELDLDVIPEDRRYPDEDYLMAETQHSGAHRDDPTWSLDPYEQQHLWSDSLEKLGVMAVRGTVPPAAITRYATLTWSEAHWNMWHDWYDRKGDRMLGTHAARREGLQRTITFFFDDIPRLQAMSEGKLRDAFYWMGREDRAIRKRAMGAVRVTDLRR